MIKKVPEHKSKYKSNPTFNEGSIEIFSFTSTQKHLRGSPYPEPAKKALFPNFLWSRK